MDKRKLKSAITKICKQRGYHPDEIGRILTDFLILEDFNRVKSYNNCDRLLDRYVGDHLRVGLDKSWIWIHPIHDPYHDDDGSLSEELNSVEPDACTSVMLEMSEYGFDECYISRWLHEN